MRLFLAMLGNVLYGKCLPEGLRVKEIYAKVRLHFKSVYISDFSDCR